MRKQINILEQIKRLINNLLIITSGGPITELVQVTNLQGRSVQALFLKEGDKMIGFKGLR